MHSLDIRRGRSAGTWLRSSDAIGDRTGLRSGSAAIHLERDYQSSAKQFQLIWMQKQDATTRSRIKKAKNSCQKKSAYIGLKFERSNFFGFLHIAAIRYGIRWIVWISYVWNLCVEPMCGSYVDICGPYVDLYHI